MKNTFNLYLVIVYAIILTICNPLNTKNILAAEFIFDKKAGFLSTFKDVNAREYSLEDFKSKLVLVNLWATWCEPCKEEMPSLDNLQTLFDKEKFLVLPINLDRGPQKNAINFLNDFNIVNIEPYFDDKNYIPREVKILGLPVTLLINASGEEVGRLIGPTDWTEESIVEIINNNLPN